MYKVKFFFILIIYALLVFSCKKPENHGSIEFFFTHTIDEQPIQFNQLIYTNKAGNQYQVNEVKYFISRMFLIDAEGRSVEVKQNNGIHYVDCSLESTLRWKINEIPQKHYAAISFVFGLDENDNISNRFVNPPECNFAWPDNLGGGYHYMQINGKFLNADSVLQNMNIHTGKVHDTHNYFTVKLLINFSVYENNTLPLTLNMEIQRWFDTPNLYNFNEFGTGIMQNQRAQELLKENGWNVFGFMN
ncbi:MAG: hypothetical protein FWC34_11385 [Bacteroidetes bacterium]|nr:hypothetical protein [Bacteroidota bacterium]MCL2302222.1 hypothetical protein [Lentimicrobiaceae bacterium]MCL2302302.1 hypothetical protein [Lentimicrobiaceae bacterium]